MNSGALKKREKLKRSCTEGKWCKRHREKIAIYKLKATGNGERPGTDPFPASSLLTC